MVMLLSNWAYANQRSNKQSTVINSLLRRSIYRRTCSLLMYGTSVQHTRSLLWKVYWSSCRMKTPQLDAPTQSSKNYRKTRWLLKRRIPQRCRTPMPVFFRSDPRCNRIWNLQLCCRRRKPIGQLTIDNFYRRPTRAEITWELLLLLIFMLIILSGRGWKFNFNFNYNYLGSNRCIWYSGVIKAPSVLTWFSGPWRICFCYVVV